MQKFPTILCAVSVLLLGVIGEWGTASAGVIVVNKSLPPCPGSYNKNTWDNCEGTKTFENGDKYVGEFKNGKPNGQGTGTFRGMTYVGQWKDFHFHGQGTASFAGGRVQEGIWENHNFQYANKISPVVSAPKPQKLKKDQKPSIKQAQQSKKNFEPSPAKTRDTTAPTITMQSAITVKEALSPITGRVSDNSKVAEVTFEGFALDLKPDGSFTFSPYVALGTHSLTVKAVDVFGNRTEHTIKVTRVFSESTDQHTFTSLNPTKIKGRSNKDAIALIIGVANYSRAPAATFADNDANVFGDFARRALGIPRSNIKVMVNEDTSNTDLKIAIKRWLRGRIEEGKTDVHVFFAGHGLASPDGNDLYLLPYNGEPSLLEETALLRRELFDVISQRKPKSATVFLDTCYSGLSRGKETLLASARGIVPTAR